MANRLNHTLVSPWVDCQFCCGLEPRVIELLPEEEAISQCEHLTTEKTTVPIRLGVEVSVSGGDRGCVIVSSYGGGAIQMGKLQPLTSDGPKAGLARWTRGSPFFLVLNFLKTYFLNQLLCIGVLIKT